VTEHCKLFIFEKGDRNEILKFRQKMLNRKTQVPSFYFDALELGNYWGCFDEPRRYHHTAPISLVYALREGLSAVAQEGIGNSIKRHQDNAKLFYEALNDLGLQPFVEKEVFKLKYFWD
jgi:alanine-glyoxylate transaminase/serine-glyoxylate transaminase/serine-pyruvate transaminase